MLPMGPGPQGDLPCSRGAVVSDGEVIQPLRLMLLGGFTLLDGTQEIELPLSAQRLVAFLALRERGLSRDVPGQSTLASLLLRALAG